MLTLIRYEMKKTMPIKIVSVALLLIFEVLLLFGSISDNIFIVWTFQYGEPEQRLKYEPRI